MEAAARAVAEMEAAARVAAAREAATAKEAAARAAAKEAAETEAAARAVAATETAARVAAKEAVGEAAEAKEAAAEAAEMEAAARVAAAKEAVGRPMQEAPTPASAPQKVASLQPPKATSTWAWGPREEPTTQAATTQASPKAVLTTQAAPEATTQAAPKATTQAAPKATPTTQAAPEATPQAALKATTQAAPKPIPTTQAAPKATPEAVPKAAPSSSLSSNPTGTKPSPAALKRYSKMRVLWLDASVAPTKLLAAFPTAIAVEAVYRDKTGERVEVVLTFPPGVFATRAKRDLVAQNSLGCGLQPAVQSMEFGPDTRKVVWTRAQMATPEPEPAKTTNPRGLSA